MSRRLAGGQDQKHFSPVGSKLYFHVNSSRKNILYWTPTWPPCQVVANQEYCCCSIFNSPLTREWQLFLRKPTRIKQIVNLLDGFIFQCNKQTCVDSVNSSDTLIINFKIKPEISFHVSCTERNTHPQLSVLLDSRTVWFSTNGRSRMNRACSSFCIQHPRQNNRLHVFLQIKSNFGKWTVKYLRSLAEIIFTQYDQHCSILLAEFNMSTLLFLLIRSL